MAVAAYMTVDAVAERYGVSRKSIHDKTRKDAIPFLKRVGFRHLLFNAEHLDSWDAGVALEVVQLPDGSKLIRPNLP